MSEWVRKRAANRGALHVLLAGLWLGVYGPGIADLSAQVLYGSLVGNIKDSSGAAVPGASVTAIHTETNRIRETISDDSGTFNFPTIRTGNWTVKVSLSGFKAFTKTDVPVTLNNITRVDVTLEVGQLAETVTVIAGAAELTTDRSEVRKEISEKALVNLPVPLARNYQSLLGYLPGLTTPTNEHSVPTNPSRALSFNVNGTSRSSNDIRIDGASNYDIWLPHITAYIPSLESIENVNVVTNSFDAEQGLAGGSAINIQIKSGTNDIHGSAFEYHTDNAIMAKPLFLPFGERNPKYIFNQLGGTLGGPIKKDKLFYFVSYEGSYERAFASRLGDIPDMAMRSGDLSASDLPVYDPDTGDAEGRNRTAFPGNIIPASRISPIAKKMLDLMPAPTFSGISNNYYAAGRYGFSRNTVDTKVDWTVTSKFNMYGRFSILHYTMDAPTFFGDALGGVVLRGGNPGHGWGNSYSSTIAGSYIVSPRFIVDANFGYTKKGTNIEQTRLDEKIGLDVLGIPGTNGTRKFEAGWPRFTIDGFQEIGMPYNFMPYYRDDPQWQIASNANWTRGKHNIRFGGERYVQHMNQTQAEFPGADHPAQGGFRFEGGVTGIRGGRTNDYNSFAAFLLDRPRRMGRIFMIPDSYTTRTRFYSLYIRDRWQIHPKFTFNIGTRWEYLPFPTRAERGMERYDFVNNKMLVCDVGSVPEDCGVEVSKTLFAPRAGLAYRLRDDFVLRAGFGLTNDPFAVARPHRTNHPMLLALNLTSANSWESIGSMKAGIPASKAPDLENGIIDIPSAVAVNSVDQKFRRGYVMTWNFTLQGKLPWGGYTWEAGYVATRQVRQLGYLDLNAGQTIGAGQSGQLYRQRFGRTARTAVFAPVGHSQYDALQVSLDRRFAAGFQMNANYTWAKSIGIAGVTNSDNGPSIQALDYFYLNRAPTVLNIPHRLNLSAVWEAPFGAGKRWLQNGAGSAILGGWQLNFLTYAHAGTPFTVTASGNSLNMPGSSQRGDQVKSDVAKPEGVGVGKSWFDPFAFEPVTETRFGTVGFNSLRGPAQFAADFGLFRKFKITEGVDIQFRAEMFNVTNTPALGNPGTNRSSMTLNADGTIRALNGYTEIRGTRNVGREGIDQRMFRFGLRLGF